MQPESRDADLIRRLDAAAVVDFGLARLAKLEERIVSSETDGLRARWEFGHELLSARDGKGRLPNGYLVAVVERTGASRAELTYRMQFAKRCQTEDELFNTVEQFGSWHVIVRDVLPEHTAVEPVGEMPPLPEGIYRTICADPPWLVARGPEWGSNGPSRPLTYPTMTVSEIAGLPVRERAAKDAHLYLWTINAYVVEAYEIARAWGFRPSTLLTWCKQPHGFGLGGTYSLTSEHVLFARRGTLTAKKRVDSTWFQWPRAAHSVKPEAFLDLVESVSPGPYLELFARRQRLGWDTWGNEAPEHVSLLAEETTAERMAAS